MAVNDAIRYSEMTDEQIVAVRRGIEKFVKDNEYFAKFMHQIKVERGAKTWSHRRAIKPKVDSASIRPLTELVAPRPNKIAVETFQHTIDLYGDKYVFSKEDVLFGYDDLVAIARDNLGSVMTQKADYIKGAPFFKSACTATAEATLLGTLEKVAVILKKNKAKRWNGAHYLAMVAPETLSGIKAEIASKGAALSEPTKEKLDAGIIGSYDIWDFTECPSDLIYKDATHAWLVCMGRRDNGDSPVDVAAMKEGIEVFFNPLGSGVLVDEDGNYTSDDNKQKGSVAANMDGLGAYVNDDLCIIDVAVSVTPIAASGILEEEKTGFVSKSGNEHEITLTAPSNGEYTVVGARYDSDATKYYGVGSTIVSVQLKASTGHTLPTLDGTEWSAKYKLASGGADKNAKILGIVKTAANYDTLLVLVPNECYSFTVANTATIS